MWGLVHSVSGKVTPSIHWTPKKFLGNHSFEEILLGEHHACGMVVEKRIYTWGSNEKLSIGDQRLYINDFVPVTSPFEVTLKEKEDTLQISVHKNTNAILTNKSVYYWGSWCEESFHFPNKLAFPQKMISKVCAGNGFLIAVSSDLEIWSAGLNNYGQVFLFCLLFKFIIDLNFYFF